MQPRTRFVYSSAIFNPVRKDLISNMKERADRCRRLARNLSDPDADILRELAREIEADIRHLERDQR